MLNIPQLKPKGLLLWWGKFRFMYGNAAFYVGALQLALVAVMAYNTTVRPWAVEYLGWNILFWQYCVFLVVSVLLGVLAEFMITVPALIAVSNEQMYKHDSPIKTDFEDVKKKQEEHDKILAEMQKTLDEILGRLEK